MRVPGSRPRESASLLFQAPRPGAPLTLNPSIHLGCPCCETSPSLSHSKEAPRLYAGPWNPSPSQIRGPHRRGGSGVGSSLPTGQLCPQWPPCRSGGGQASGPHTAVSSVETCPMGSAPRPSRNRSCPGPGSMGSVGGAQSSSHGHGRPRERESLQGHEVGRLHPAAASWAKARGSPRPAAAAPRPGELPIEQKHHVSKAQAGHGVLPGREGAGQQSGEPLGGALAPCPGGGDGVGTCTHGHARHTAHLELVLFALSSQ